MDAIDRMRPCPKYTWSKTDKIIRFKDCRSIIQFKSAEDPELLRGVGLDWLWLDEAAVISQMAWDVLYTRLDKAWSQCWITTTPKGYNWVYEKLYRRSLQHQPDGKITKNEAHHEDYEAWRFFTRQNTRAPQLTQIDADAKLGLAEEFYRQEYEASFEHFTGLIYKDFNRDRHVRLFDPNPDWDVYVGIDPGATDPTAILFVSVDYSGSLFVWDESYETGQTISYHAGIIKQKLAGRNPSMVVIDPSAKQESLDFAEYGVYPSETDLSHKRNIRPGILRIQELLRRGKIVVHPRCENLIREFESYQWDDKRSLDRNQGDQPRDKDNHALDAIRYLAMVAPDPSTEKKDEHMTPEQILVKKESEQIERAFNEVWRVKISMEDSYGADGTET